jgi:crotonobetainyl-CoA:carnitine CoA-transferase CaiB-like acyl-CoA transferase
MGEHTKEVLASLGISEAEITAMYDASVVA